MKLLEVAKKGSGRGVVVQLTFAEMVNIIAMFKSVLMHANEGFTKEKKMLSSFEKILFILEDCARHGKGFEAEKCEYGQIYYEYKENGGLDQVQRFIGD